MTIFITGPGRSGTGLTLEILKACGFNINPVVDGVEWPISRKAYDLPRCIPKDASVEWPEVIKLPSWRNPTSLDRFLEKEKLLVQHIFYTTNTLEQGVVKHVHASANRTTRRFFRLTHEQWQSIPIEEKEELYRKHQKLEVGNFVYGAIEREWPFTIVSYQRLCLDRKYAFEHLGLPLGVDKETFDRAWEGTIDLERLKIRTVTDSGVQVRTYKEL